MHEDARPRVGLGHGVGVEIPGLGLDDDPDLEVVGPGELEVALVVAGNRHDRPRAVVGQHVVGGPHGDVLAVDRVDRHRGQRHALAHPIRRHPLHLGLPPHLLQEARERLLELGPGDQLGAEGVLGSENEERGAPQRVGSRGEHRVVHGGEFPARRVDPEGHLGPPAAPGTMYRSIATR